MANEEAVSTVEMAQAIGKAIVEQANRLADYGDSKLAAAGLKDLAEAVAWLKHPNQPH